MRISSCFAPAAHDTSCFEAASEEVRQATAPRKCFPQPSNWPDSLMNIVLEYLSSLDQFALTSTCTIRRALRYDDTPWKKNSLARTLTPTSKEELFYIPYDLQYRTFRALKLPFELDLSALPINNAALLEYL